MEILNSFGKNSSFKKSNSWKELAEEKKFAQLSFKEQEELVLQYLPKVKIIALRLKSKLPKHIELDELISAGTVGLLSALKNFDPKLNIQFETYAETRIRGAMLDELRKMDWFSRSMRTKMKKIEQILQEQENLKLDLKKTKEKIQAKTGLSLEEIEEVLVALQNQLLISLDAIKHSLSTEENLEYQPQEKIIHQDLVDKLTKLIKELTKKEQLVLSLYYVEELTMKEVANILEVTEGRVSQLHAQALQKLKKKFKEKFEPVEGGKYGC